MSSLGASVLCARDQLQGAEKMWEIQYGARSVYGLEALDGSNFAELSSSFFNSSGAAAAQHPLLPRRTACGPGRQAGQALPFPNVSRLPYLLAEGQDAGSLN